MQKIRFGKTELMVSKVALGGIPIMRISKTDAAELVRGTIGMGINFIDTAHVYSDSEEKIGEGIKGMRRDDLVIASKSPADDKKTFNEHLDLSLKRLGVDYIDIYQLHNIGSEQRRDAVFAPGGAYEGLTEAVKAGKVRFPAFSSHSLPISLELVKCGRFDAVQFPFNYIDNAAEAELIPLAKKLDIGFIAMKPLGGGLLDNAGLSFRYLLQFNSIIPDPGVEKIGEIREIADIVTKNPALTENDKREIEKLRAEFGPSWCHRCDYCQPCPQGIAISSVLGARSMMRRFSPERFRSMIGPAMEKAKTCRTCGVCVSRCPYHLEIPRLLKENLSNWDGQTKAG
ncbi:MAG: aldo/keto reductase [Treponema sp.]|jgi:predicted aldo/keto reductase-like oxidoreductase|nr:aldo/keto reductase [Treponema sp.]